VLIIYTNVCTPCKYRSQLAYVNRLARQQNTQVKIVETKYNPNALLEVRAISDMPLPFVYNDDTKMIVRLLNIQEYKEI
jgi:hypothetical protein